MKKNYMKKQFILTLFIGLFFTSAASAQSSIDEVIRNFNTAFLNASIPKAEVAIGFISYANTETSGTIVPWLQTEIKKAAGKTRRISIVRSGSLDTQEQTGIATRGASFGKTKKAANNKFILSGTYYENNNMVELTLELSTTDGTLFASETALIPLTEITNRHLNLYPENKRQAEDIKETFEKAAEEIQTKKKVLEKKEAKDITGTEDSDSIEITAAMLDKDFNLVDILFPGDTVQFMVSTDKDAYISIMGIDANGIRYSLPVNNNFLKAGNRRIFPDSDVEYQVLDNVFGAEYLLIYAASDPSGLPPAVEDGTYTSETIIKATRRMSAVKKTKKIHTGIFIIPYTVMKKN